MTIEKEKYIIETDTLPVYLDELLNHLDEKTEQITSFFQITKYDTKIKIVIWDDLEKYKEHISKYMEYRDYMCGDTCDGNINILTLEEAHKEPPHKDMTLRELKNVTAHEFVHICHRYVQQGRKQDDYKDTWYYEVLATNLGNPDDFTLKYNEITHEKLLNFNKENNNYSMAYAIGRYMFENYSEEEMLEFAKYPKKLALAAEEIIDGTMEWLKTKLKYK